MLSFTEICFDPIPGFGAIVDVLIIVEKLLQDVNITIVTNKGVIGFPLIFIFPCLLMLLGPSAQRFGLTGAGAGVDSAWEQNAARHEVAVPRVQCSLIPAVFLNLKNAQCLTNFTKMISSMSKNGKHSTDLIST